MQKDGARRSLRNAISRALLLSTTTLALTCVAGTAFAQGGTWTKVNTNPFGSNGLTELLTDGSVLVQYGDWHDWAKLTPDANGN